jgi:heavy metal sensor kinase
LSIAGKFFKTVTFRLTLWYAILFFAASLVVFGIVYFRLVIDLSRRMDEALVQRADEIEILYKTEGLESVKQELVDEGKSGGSERIFLRIITPQMGVIETSDVKDWKDISLPKGIESLPVGQKVIESLRTVSHRHHVPVVSKKMFDGNIIQIGSTRHDDEDLLEAFREVFLTAIMVFLICGGLVGWFMARRAMSGVERVTQTAVSIGKDDLTSRVPYGDEGEEIHNLARAFNEMLTRIQGLFTELKDVTNNIAHDLRSPITRIRGLAETTLTGEQDIHAYREVLGAVVEESDRLVGMINIILEIAMTESGVQVTARDKVDMRNLVVNAYDLFQVLAEDKGIHLELNVPADSLFIRGNSPQLQRMIGNLLDNAIKFTPNGGFIELSLHEAPKHLILTIADTGIGISEQDLPRIFERFYRGDQSRSTSGNGLGLSYVSVIVNSHGGKMTVKSILGKGSFFVVILPKWSV